MYSNDTNRQLHLDKFITSKYPCNIHNSATEFYILYTIYKIYIKSSVFIEHRTKAVFLSFLRYIFICSLLIFIFLLLSYLIQYYF
jgi:hypothetical protein